MTWQGFPQLHCLDVSETSGVTSNDLLLVAPQLLSLSVHGCDRVGCLLFEHLHNCVCLDICGIGIYGVSNLIKGTPQLRHLYISEFRKG
ncbi:hypothetical protein COCOBI_15-0560 [Coccomyxa sp. Obi]|nr:hypothetical protein COCOBI_15-0560 [Coccomyxa sp. Obi]